MSCKQLQGHFRAGHFLARRREHFFHPLFVTSVAKDRYDCERPPGFGRHATARILLGSNNYAASVIMVVAERLTPTFQGRGDPTVHRAQIDPDQAIRPMIQAGPEFAAEPLTFNCGQFTTE